MSRTKLAQRTYYWIGQALDKYADGPFDAPQTRAIASYHATRTAERRASRISALQAQARRAAQPGYADPGLEYFEAAPPQTSIHAAPCGTGSSWSAHHAKAPTATLARTPGNKRVSDLRHTIKPRNCVPRSPVWPTRHVEPGDFSISQALFDEDLQAQRDFDALMLEISSPTARMKKFVRFS